MADSNKKSDDRNADIPESAFEEALRAVESIERKTKEDKKQKVVTSQKQPEMEKDASDNPADLESLLNLLNSSAPQKPAKPVANSSKVHVLSEEDSILADLLGEEMDLEKEAEFFRKVLFGENEAKEKAPATKSPPSSQPPQFDKRAVEEKDRQVTQLTERLSRLQAEFENYRKRVIREAKEAKKFYNDKLILDFLPIVDNFERAIEHMKGYSDQQSVLEGVQLIYRQVIGMLENNGLQAIDSNQEPFNPLYHEAVTTMFDKTVAPGTILSEYERGYLLNGRLLRPSRVAVSTNENGMDESSEPGDQTEQANNPDLKEPVETDNNETSECENPTGEKDSTNEPSEPGTVDDQ